MIRKAITVALVINALALTACNTVRGVGRDVQSVADSVDRAT
jgi:predicted small secreted protein